MTTAHRPTWAPAVGGEEQGGNRLFVPSRAYSAKDEPSHTKLKFRWDTHTTCKEPTKLTTFWFKTLNSSRLMMCYRREEGQSSKVDVEKRDLLVSWILFSTISHPEIVLPSNSFLSWAAITVFHGVQLELEEKEKKHFEGEWRKNTVPFFRCPVIREWLDNFLLDSEERKKDLFLLESAEKAAGARPAAKILVPKALDADDHEAQDESESDEEDDSDVGDMRLTGFYLPRIRPEIIIEQDYAGAHECAYT